MPGPWVRVWGLATSAAASTEALARVGEMTIISRTEALALVDTDRVRDELGRGVLAAHLHGLLDQLTAEQDAFSAVVHIDGRWGSGKTTLIRLLLERLRDTDQRAVVDGGSAPAAGLRDPLVVRYDAWRESVIAPEWWSLATAINRTVRSARSRVTRAYLTCWGVVVRTLRSPAVIAALGLFVSALAAWRLGLWRGNADGLGKVVTTLTGLAVLALGIGRLLFWYAPALGKLHLHTDDNPLGEIAAMVGWLRRWSPRDPARQRSRDRLAGTLLVVLIAAAVGGLWLRFGVLAHPVWWFPAVVVGALFLTGGAVIAWHQRWCRRLGPPDRRPLLLVIDDLDRCSAERVVRLLEAVHTLMRDPEAVRLTGWRSSARLVVLVLADSRWVRAAFNSTFSTFDSLGSPVHSLGADFLQKVFDHTVLVPALSAGQVRNYVEVQLRSPALPSSHTTAAGAGRDVAGTPAEIDHARRSKQLADQRMAQVEQADPANLRTEAMSARIEDPALTTQDRLRLEELRALREATSSKVIASRSEHLLQQYVALMPANPRLVKRVANTFGMLLAVKGHLGHIETEDTIVRAAIMFVRFPSLVDSLLSDPAPPVVDPSNAKEDSPWLRPDVQQLLADVDLRRLARCFGQEYPATPPESQ